ncbi:hypothetical protein MLD38_021969 [Melastoma candidum]|nr:hypothetical protein MLD38_021969 [Melastoma candidum]
MCAVKPEQLRLQPYRFPERISGYVSQDNALFPSPTVEEATMYSVFPRLPVSKKDAADRVRTLMKDIGLAHVVNARIGSGSNSGISGGQKTRVLIAVELIHDPAVILPTLGIESGSALHVMKLLKSMAVFQRKTVTVMISLDSEFSSLWIVLPCSPVG